MCGAEGSYNVLLRQLNGLLPESYQREGQPHKIENEFSHDLGKSGMAVFYVF